MPSHNPAVRIHPTSTPTPKSMLAPAPFLHGMGFDAGFLSAPRGFRDTYTHKRASSGSSVASGGPPSPLSQTTIHPRIATSDATYAPQYDFDFTQATSNHVAKMPTMMYPPGFEAVDMRRLQSSGPDDRASYAGRSVSSMSHNSPATPHTNYENEYDEKMFGGKTMIFDDMDAQYLHNLGYPSSAYQQSLQDVFPDQTFGSMAFAQQHPQQQQQQQQQQQSTRMSHNMMRDRLQAAQQDHLRTSSPAHRERSPFRPASDYMTTAPRPQPVPTLQKQRTSVSPKELMLADHDITEQNYTSLFPTENYTHRRSNAPLIHTYAPTQQETVGIPQQYPFVSQRSQDELNETPDFPAHLISMESTNEDAFSQPSSQQSLQSLPTRVKREGSAKPVDTSSDAGTYSCTYHGCHLRFDTPAKLQKHKREGHRQQSPSTQPSTKNSQAGPHKCERLNPQTGKPCNSIFSRPYDLTRHEDTIHNARKQKVRCHLCTEEKTFSRNDALTRHMRVVHPDVDWIGKTRRKSQK